MIDLYFSGNGSDEMIRQYCIENNVPRLFSYLLDKKVIEKYTQDGFNNIFLDSGAFSVHNSNKKVDIDEYIKYINENKDKFKVIASLDDISDPEKSLTNYKYIIERVTCPDKILPTYHIGEPLSYLEEYTKCASYIGIGGIAAHREFCNQRYIRKIVDLIHHHNKDIKIHIFGVTKLSILEGLTITSVDSTSWLKYQVYGLILDPVSRKTHYIGKNDLTKYDDIEINAETKKILDYLKTDIEGLRKDRKLHCLFNLISFINEIEKVDSTPSGKLSKLF